MVMPTRSCWRFLRFIETQMAAHHEPIEPVERKPLARIGKLVKRV